MPLAKFYSVSEISRLLAGHEDNRVYACTLEVTTRLNNDNACVAYSFVKFYWITVFSHLGSLVPTNIKYQDKLSELCDTLASAETDMETLLSNTQVSFIVWYATP